MNNVSNETRQPCILFRLTLTSVTFKITYIISTLLRFVMEQFAVIENSSIEINFYRKFPQTLKKMTICLIFVQII